LAYRRVGLAGQVVDFVPVLERVALVVGADLAAARPESDAHLAAAAAARLLRGRRGAGHRDVCAGAVQPLQDSGLGVLDAVRGGGAREREADADGEAERDEDGLLGAAAQFPGEISEKEHTAVVWPGRLHGGDTCRP